MKIKNKIDKIIILTGLLIAQPVKAQTFGNPFPSVSGGISFLAGNWLQQVLGLVGVVALLLFIYAGFVWMTAKGDAEKIKKSTRIMLYAAIGLFVIFAAYIMVKFVFGVLN